MRSIYLNEEHERFRHTIRQFMEKEVAPFADQWELDCRIPKDIWLKMGKMGFLGIPFAEALGGSGADIFYSIVFLEELARSRMGGFCAAVSVQQYIATGAIEKQGSPEQKQRYLIPSIRGEKVGAISISEPDTGSDVAAIATIAVRDGESYVINGAKTWVTNGVYADFYVIACKTDRDAGAGGISLLLVDAGTPGLKATKLKKMGWHSSDTAELSLENVRVPVTHLVGEENMGFYSIMETFVMERLTVAANSVGSSALAIEDTLAYMESRQAFGKPINRFQALRHRLADLITELEAAKQLVYHAAWLHGQGEQAVAEASMAKLQATEVFKRVVDECLQFHGGFGYVEEYPIARAYRDARVSTIVAGTSEIMREIIAKARIDQVEFKKPATPSTVPDLMRSLPLRLRKDKTEGWSARVHFKFKGAQRPEWTVSIDSGSCTVKEGLEGTADCVVTTTEAVYLAVEQGRQNPQMAVISGKLKISSVAVMMKFTKAFAKVAP